MLNVGRARLQVEGLSAFGAVDKLTRRGVTVLSAQKTPQNGVFLEVACKDLKKAFAILRASCYNVKKVRYLGAARLMRRAAARLGLLFGAALFCLAAVAAQSLVLRIEVTGSGAYYETEALAILREHGVRLFAAAPRDPATLSAEILSLPRVSYCSLHAEGGVLTVEIEVSDEAAPLRSGPLRAPQGGTVRELIAVRGTPCVAEGQEVAAGDVLVSCARGDGTEGYVIAGAVIAVPFCEEIAASSPEEALNKLSLLYGETEEVHSLRTENGYRLEGVALISVRINMG